MRLLPLAFLLTTGVLPAFSGDAAVDATPLRIPTLDRVPELTEFVEGAPATAALHIRDFHQRQPVDGASPTVPTSVFLAYTDRALYVVFVCADDPAKVRAHLSRRESVSGDDLVGVAIDTFHDRRRAYMFYANPGRCRASQAAGRCGSRVPDRRRRTP